MKSSTQRTIVVIGLLLAVLILILPNFIQDGAAQSTTPLIVGLLKDSQDQPISGAKVTLKDPSVDLVVNESESQDNGRFALVVPRQVPDELSIHIERPHFDEELIVIPSEGINRLRIGQTVVLEDTVMSRQINIAFWVAAAVFVVVLILIASDWLHNTLAVLLGASVIYAVTYLGTPIIEDLFIFGFERSLTYIDWNVIFLIMGMMIVIAVVENTGVFQWLAYFAYRISRGNTIQLLIILMLITGIASAFLDNVTTMLLMTPITVQIALAIGINPLALLIPE
ncbi:MAG: SLC13 family permease, partial [Anaerolineales bacterium]